MAELHVESTLLLITLNLFILEFFFTFCYCAVFENSKIMKIKKLNVLSFNLIGMPENSIILPVIFAFLLSQKGYLSFFLISVTLSLLFSKLNSSWLLIKLDKEIEPSIITNLTPVIVMGILSLNYIKSLLSLFFIVELFSVFYFFLFLSGFKVISITPLHYKNSLLFLLLNNFLTTVFLTVSCILLLRELGTVYCVDLDYLNTPTGLIYIYIFGLFWKLGYPLFHFFKLELYRYLIRENLLIFSIVTTIVGFSLLVFILTQPAIFTALSKNNLLILLFVSLVSITISKLKTINFFEFLGISGLLTMSTFIVLYLTNFCLY